MLTDFEKEDINNIAELPYDWKKLKDKTILISGGTGFIGSFFSEVIRFRNDVYSDNIGIISLSRKGGESDDTVKQVKSDITEPIKMNEKIDYILHLASNTHPAQYASDPVGTINTNIIGCNNLLKLAKEKNIKRFLLASSVEIYGQGSEKSMNGKYSGYIDCNQGRSGYNEAKRTCETLVQSYRVQYGIDAVIARIARTFGADKKNDTKAMSQFISKAVTGEDIILKSTGKQRYSFSYIADTVSGIIKVLLDGIDGEAYNISADDEGLTLGDYAEFIAALSNNKVQYHIESDSFASNSTFALLDTDKLKSLGWKPQYTVHEGLERTYKILVERNNIN